jgi:hypothetical protein
LGSFKNQKNHFWWRRGANNWGQGGTIYCEIGYLKKPPLKKIIVLGLTFVAIKTQSSVFFCLPWIVTWGLLWSWYWDLLWKTIKPLQNQHKYSFLKRVQIILTDFGFIPSILVCFPVSYCAVLIIITGQCGSSKKFLFERKEDLQFYTMLSSILTLYFDSLVCVFCARCLRARVIYIGPFTYLTGEKQIRWSGRPIIFHLKMLRFLTKI